MKLHPMTLRFHAWLPASVEVVGGLLADAVDDGTLQGWVREDRFELVKPARTRNSWRPRSKDSDFPPGSHSGCDPPSFVIW